MTLLQQVAHNSGNTLDHTTALFLSLIWMQKSLICLEEAHMYSRSTAILIIEPLICSRPTPKHHNSRSYTCLTAHRQRRFFKIMQQMNIVANLFKTKSIASSSSTRVAVSYHMMREIESQKTQCAVRALKQFPVVSMEMRCKIRYFVHLRTY